MPNDDLVMESTTDSAEQIAHGLGVELADLPESADAGEEQASAEPATEVVEAEEPAEEAAPVGEVTPHPNAVRAPRAPRQQRKTADAAAAAARRKAEADRLVLVAENDALKRRLAELSVGHVAAHPASGTTEPVAPVAVGPEIVVDVDPSEIPDTHPDVAKALAHVTALGAKPRQEDFEDYTKFEDARDTWIEQRAARSARVEFAREGVARREAIARSDANRAAQRTATAFAQTVVAAKAQHADYDEKMAQARQAGWTISGDLRTALMESPVGGEVTYYLVSHPEELARLNGLTPHRAIVELGVLEGRIQAAARPSSTATAAPSPRPGVRTTRAPEPQKVLMGDFSSNPRGKDINDPDLSLAEYNRLRDQMDVESGRRQAR